MAKKTEPLLMRLLIDGYNLIPTIPELRRLLRQDLEAGRARLVEFLGAYKRSAGSTHSITVIFDGKGGNLPNPPSRERGIEIRFSRSETADDLILRLLREKMAGAVLVTSDRALGAAAAPFASAVIRSGEFADRLIQAWFMEDGAAGEEVPPRRLSTKKKGNPRRLPKRERERRRRLEKL